MSFLMLDHGLGLVEQEAADLLEVAAAAESSSNSDLVLRGSPKGVRLRAVSAPLRANVGTSRRRAISARVHTDVALRRVTHGCETANRERRSGRLRHCASESPMSDAAATKRGLSALMRKGTELDNETYSRLLRPHRRLLRQLQLEFDFFREDVGQLNVFSVETRIKSRESALAKAKRFGVNVEDLYDLAGMRVVVSTRSEVEVVKRFFTMKPFLKTATIEKAEVVSHPTGYRSTHLVLAFSGSAERGSMHAVKVEVQLPTIFEHSFNFISRAWVYKSERSYTHDWRERFAKLSSTLAQVDEGASSLHEEVIASVTRGSADAPLSPLSYREVVQQEFAENISIEEAVDSCRHVVDLGCTTIGAFREFLRLEEMRKLWEEFSALAIVKPDAVTFTERRSLFWLTMGPRRDWAREFLQQLRDERSA